MNWGDEQKILTWRNHPDVRRNMYTHDDISEDVHHQWIYERLMHRHPGELYLIANDGSTDVGFVSFTKYHHFHRTADWAFYKAPEAPKGTGTKMERAALEYAFETLKLEKLSCEVLAYNKPVYYLHRKHGFQCEGVFRKAHLFEGERHDIYRLAIFKGDWKDALEQTMVGTIVSLAEDVYPDWIEQFCKVIEDENPIHQGPNAIAPGMYTGSLFSGAIAERWPGAVYLSQSLNFRKMVRAGETLDVFIKVVSQIRRKIWCETTIERKDEIVLDGEAVVLLP